MGRHKRRRRDLDENGNDIRPRTPGFDRNLAREHDPEGPWDGEGDLDDYATSLDDFDLDDDAFADDPSAYDPEGDDFDDDDDDEITPLSADAPDDDDLEDFDVD